MGLIVHHLLQKGAENKVADAISRASYQDPSEVVDISIIQPSWLNDLQAAYSIDPQAKELLTKLSVNPVNGLYTLSKGIIRYKDIIWLGISKSLQQKVLQALHTNLVGGHSGYEATYNRVKGLFAWPNMKSTFKKFVDACITCQQV